MNITLAELELPIRIRTGRPMTDEELGRFCSENEPLKIERDANGELIVMSPNWTEGGGRESKVGGYLFIWTLADGRGEFYGSNTGFKLPDNSVRSADAAWVSLKKLNALTADERRGYARFCPEFVIEVRSDTDLLPPLREKMEVWIANGAELGWLIDPERRVVEVYRAGEAVEVFEDPTSVQGTGPVRGFELVMGRVWG
jgi:Uma2 family endonuclease